MNTTESEIDVPTFVKQLSDDIPRLGRGEEIGDSGVRALV